MSKGKIISCNILRTSSGAFFQISAGFSIKETRLSILASLSNKKSASCQLIRGRYPAYYTAGPALIAYSYTPIISQNQGFCRFL